MKKAGQGRSTCMLLMRSPFMTRCSGPERKGGSYVVTRLTIRVQTQLTFHDPSFKASTSLHMDIKVSQTPCIWWIKSFHTIIMPLTREHHYLTAQITKKSGSKVSVLPHLIFKLGSFLQYWLINWLRLIYKISRDTRIYIYHTHTNKGICSNRGILEQGPGVNMIWNVQIHMYKYFNIDSFIIAHILFWRQQHTCHWCSCQLIYTGIIENSQRK